METETSYDRVPYRPMSFPKQNPARIAAVGRLYGLKPGRPSGSRVLELGCGQGFTALGLAQVYPESEFLAVDLSVKQAAVGSRLAEAAGLKNLRVEGRSILDVSKEKDGEFDYITCHGVFSWVPNEVQEKILEICGTMLKPQGMAYLSYNTLPGWSHLRVIREMLVYHCSRFEDPMEKVRQGKALVALLRDCVPGGADSWTAKFTAHAAQMVDQADPAYFLHEYLEDSNEPCYFSDFMARAETHGLQFVSEMPLTASLPGMLGPHVGKLVDLLQRSVVDREQYMDFLRNTQFRTTLLCRKEVSLDRNLQMNRAASMAFASCPTPEVSPVKLAAGENHVFGFPGGKKFGTSDPLAKALLVAMGNQKDQFLGLRSLAAEAKKSFSAENVPSPAGTDEDMFLGLVLNALAQLVGSGLVELSDPDVGCWVPHLGVMERPVTVPLNRTAAAEHKPPLRWDFNVMEIGEDAAVLLALCDGTRTQGELFAAFKAAGEAGAYPPPAPPMVGEQPDYRAAFVAAMRYLAQNRLLWKPVGT